MPEFFLLLIPTLVNTPMMNRKVFDVIIGCHLDLFVIRDIFQAQIAILCLVDCEAVREPTVLQ